MNRNLDTYIAVFRTVGEVLFLYGLLGWIYGVLVQITHPDWLACSLSHLITWIRVDTFTIVSFILSIAGFFMWRLVQEMKKQH